MLQRGRRRGDRSLERRSGVSTCHPFVERLEERSLLAGTGWRESLFSFFPYLGLPARGEPGAPGLPQPAVLAVLTGGPQTEFGPSSGNPVPDQPRTPLGGKAPELSPPPTAPLDRYAVPPPQPPDEPPPPPKGGDTPQQPPASEPPVLPPPDSGPQDPVPPEEDAPMHPPPDGPPNPRKAAEPKPAGRGGPPPGQSSEPAATPNTLAPDAGHAPRNVWQGGLASNGFGTDLWDMRRWDGVGTHHSAGGLLPAHDMVLSEETPQAALAAGHALARTWSVRRAAETAASAPDHPPEPVGARTVTLDPLATALLSRAWEQAPGGGEPGLPGTAPGQLGSAAEPSRTGAGQTHTGTTLLVTPTATSWLGEVEGSPALSFHSVEAAWAVSCVCAEAGHTAAEDAAADRPAFLVADAPTWEALAAGTGMALVQSSGPAGGTQSGAVAEEDRTPWELLFAPLLFGFATPRYYQATILLIEHDEPTRDAFHELLVQQGYLVLAAGTAHDAWGVIRAPLAPIDLVLLDAHLPDVSGMMLYARLRELYPDLPVVVCTGGELDPDELARFRDMGAPFYLRKPIAQEKLLATVQAVLR